ncbi:MAG: putative DNA modification/repair radical SAM protein [Ruminococcaceae bacterium]|jgi:putative DNA modification/repair radical SAM protein|nr:putative DNA modification/repair radical SAM protein [Oscillospiraceae bacterium]
MDLLEKLTILSDAAKYDAACTSSGVRRGFQPGKIGNTSSSIAGCCHSFSADGRCITLLKVLMTNSCVYDCKYCVNRRSNDTRRAAFTPRELAELTIGFYRRNYIEGLFLSSGVLRSPDYTTEQMVRCLRILRQDYAFNGYIHAKAIPGTSPELVYQLGLLADRLSVNIELPSEAGLQTLAPDKNKAAILRPMGQIRDRAAQSKAELVKYRHAPSFAPAGQSTQLIVGATEDSDRHILHLTESLYERYRLKRVFYSAYVPVVEHSLLPAPSTKPPLLREHRLYQADWLLRFYGFRAEELLTEAQPDFNPLIDPKCHWALNHLEQFPVEIMRADYETLLRVPGIGPVSARRIVSARRMAHLTYEDLKKLGVVVKRAQFFTTCGGRIRSGLRFSAATLANQLESIGRGELPADGTPVQLSLFDNAG